MKLSYYLVLFLAALYAPSANAAQALPANLKALERSVLKLLRSGQDQPGVVQAVVSMSNLVQTFLMPHLATLNNDDYKAMRNANTGFDACQADHNSYHASIANLSEAHKSCRFEESDLKQQMDLACGDEKKRKADKYIADCAMFALVRDPPAELPSVCDKTPRTTNQGESGRLANYFMNLRDTYREWKFKCNAAENASEVHNASCDNLTSMYGNKSAACDQKQIDLDSTACWQYRQGDCEAFTRCWEQATRHFIAFNISIANAVIARKEEFSGLKRILCYLDIVNKSYSTQPEAPSGAYLMKFPNGTEATYNFIGSSIYIQPLSFNGWQGFAIWQRRSQKTSGSAYASTTDYPFEIIGGTENGKREIFSFKHGQIQLKHYDPSYCCDIDGMPIDGAQVSLVREQVGLAQSLAQEKRTQLACEPFILGQACPTSHCVWRQQKCDASCWVFSSAMTCPDVRCGWNGTHCEDNQDAVCGSSYHYSHNGYWGDIYTLHQPFGKVSRSIASTIEQCRSTCNSVTGCIAYSFGTDELCWIYDHIAEVDWVETSGLRSPACRLWNASSKVTRYIGSVCGETNNPACDEDRWNNDERWDNGVPDRSMDAILTRSGKLTVNGNVTPIYTGRLTFGQGANLVMENENAVIGCSNLVFEDSSVLQNCQQSELSLPRIELTGRNAHFEATCMGSAGASTKFHGIGSTADTHLTVRGGNGHIFYFSSAGFYAHLTAFCHSAYAIHARAEFALGTGGVTISARQQNCPACPILNLDVQNTIDDGATLELNCQDEKSNIKVNIAEGVNEAVAALVVNNSRMPDGVYSKDNSDFITGGGTLVVGHVEDEILCEMQSYDTTGLNIIALYYETHEPKMPSQPPCLGDETWPRPGTAEYVQQEYDVLPEDAPARDCQSVCCLWCNFYDCPGGLHFENASCTKEYSLDQCCDSVGWKATPWVLPVCQDICGQASRSATRTVHCQDAEATIQPDSACVNLTKPPVHKHYCDATAPCAACVAGFCSEIGSYLKGCGANGGFDQGECAYCTIADGYYATGIGGVNQDNCPSALCSDRAVCPGGEYLFGCGGRIPGECRSCQQTCLIGFYADGCTGMTVGTCHLCDIPRGVLSITSGASSTDQCDFVTQTEATDTGVDGATDLTNVNGYADFSTWTLDVDARLHRAVLRGEQFNFIKLTEQCGNFDITPGWMSSMFKVKSGKTYKVSAEAAWWPTSGSGLKGDPYCPQKAASVLQFKVAGAATEDWFGANVTACFDEVTHSEWHKVWFDFAPIEDGPVTLTFKESKFSCLSIKSVKVYELEHGE